MFLLITTSAWCNRCYCPHFVNGKIQAQPLATCPTCPTNEKASIRTQGFRSLNGTLTQFFACGFAAHGSVSVSPLCLRSTPLSDVSDVHGPGTLDRALALQFSLNSTPFYSENWDAWLSGWLCQKVTPNPCHLLTYTLPAITGQDGETCPLL